MNLFHEAKKILDKDGKVNPLGPYGKMKLTGQEVANYFRKNKVSDAKVKRAVEVALDMSGAMDIASKEIKKFFGDKILKSKEVQNALRYANEETVSEGMKMKDIMRKHKRELNKAYKTGDLSFMSSAGRKAEDDLMQWAYDNGEVNTDDPDDFFDWLSRDLEDIVKGKIKEDLDENYRTLAKHGMGAEDKKSIKVGTEVDYYQKDGAKYMGKITKMSAKGYTVRDDKTKKDHEFMYHDRVKAKKLLKQGDNTEAVSVAQQAAIAIDRKEKRSKGAYKNVMDSYKQMWEDGQKYAPQLDEEVSNITVDPRNKISKPADQNKHALEIAKQAKRFGLKSSIMGKHVRLKGNKKAVNDFLRIIIGKSSYGDPTEKDTSTPQIDKMLTKELK